MKKIMAICLALVLALSLPACGKTDENPETAAAILPEQADEKYGILQDLIDEYGFPFELRFTEGMELTNFTFQEDHANREWHTSSDNTSHDNLKWNLSGSTLTLSGAWEESFALDMERGTATSLADGAQYRFVVHLPDSIDTKWYVSWDTDAGFTEIDGVRYESGEDFAVSNGVYLCQFVKDCLGEPDSFQIHGVSHMEEDGYHYFYLDFSHEIKNEKTERTCYYAQFIGSTLLCIVNENSAIYYQTEGDYTTKYPALSARFQENPSAMLDVAEITSALK